MTTELAGWQAGRQADRWCADNAVTLAQRTKALRAGWEIHLAEMEAGRRGGPDRVGIVEEERVGRVSSLVCTDIPASHVTLLIHKQKDKLTFSSVFLSTYMFSIKYRQDDSRIAQNDRCSRFATMLQLCTTIRARCHCSGHSVNTVLLWS